MTPYHGDLAHRREQAAAEDRVREAGQAKGFGPVPPNANSWRDCRWSLETWAEVCAYRAEMFAGSELGALYVGLLADLKKYTNAASVTPTNTQAMQQ